MLLTGPCIFAALFLARQVKFVGQSLSRLDRVCCKSTQAATLILQVWVARLAFKSVNAVPGICRCCETRTSKGSA
jgi:hypothetical protein